MFDRTAGPFLVGSAEEKVRDFIRDYWSLLGVAGFFIVVIVDVVLR